MRKSIQMFLIAILISACTNKKENSETKIGRYQLMQSSKARRDQYLLDTATGKMWNVECAYGGEMECRYEYWAPVDIVDITTSIDNVMATASKMRDLNQSKKPK